MTILEQLYSEDMYGEAAVGTAKVHARHLHDAVEMLEYLDDTAHISRTEREYGAVEYLVSDYRALPDVGDLEAVAKTPLAETEWNHHSGLAFTVTPVGSLALEAYRALDEEERP